jgi:hypothetical protein
VAQIHPIYSAAAFDGPVMNGEDHSVSLTKRLDYRSALHPWPLLGHHELPAGKIRLRVGEQDCHLQGKHVIAVKILMQAVIVTDAVAEKERA